MSEKAGERVAKVIARAGLCSRREAEARTQALRKAEQARRLWTEAEPITGTAAETYLRGRKLTCALPPTLRFHPAAWHGPTATRHPAMLGLVQGGDGFAIHRTYLRPGGTGSSGICSRGATRRSLSIAML